MIDPKDQIPAEELELETEGKQDKKEEEVKAAIVAEFGFDEVDDAEKIDKLVKKEMAHHSKLSTAIGQKIKYRDAANAPKPELPKPAEPAKPEPVTDVSKVVKDTLEQRDLEDMDLPDAIKAEIKRVAQIQGVSVKQAARDPYIVTKIDDHKKAQKNEDAALGRTNKGATGGGRKNWSIDAPPDSDMTTPEGRKEWDDYLKWAKEQGH